MRIVSWGFWCMEPVSNMDRVLFTLMTECRIRALLTTPKHLS